MARIVVGAARGGKFAGENINQLPADSYVDRIVKYIPIESVAFYTLVDKLLIDHYKIEMSGQAQSADAMMLPLSWAFLVLGVVCTPLYLRRKSLANQPWKLHALISTVAFVAWAYSTGGSVFLLMHWYHVLLAALVAPIVTFVAGAFEPR